MSLHDFRDDSYYMGLAVKMAKIAKKLGEVPIGAVLTDSSGKILAMAHNEPIRRTDPTAHAEIIAIRKAAKRINNYRLVGCSIYVTLEPCSMCFSAMIHARIKRLIYGTDDPKSGALSSGIDLTDMEVFNHYIEVKGGVLAEDCGSILREFFINKRRGTEVVVTGSTRNRLVR